MNAIHTVRLIHRATIRCIRYTLAPYCVADNYGTYIYCWTRKAAMQILPACGPIACIFNLYTGKEIVSRVQSSTL